MIDDNKIYKVIDLSGFGNSGKTAVTNFFQEFTSNFWVAEQEFEFEILRIKNGLLDLENAIVNTWSPSRTSTTMYEFLKLVNYIGNNPSKYNLFGRLFNSGLRLDRRFNDKFTSISTEYFNSLVAMEDNAFNLYPFQNLPKYMMPIVKILISMGKRHLLNESNILTVSNKKIFYKETKKYLNNLCKALDQDNKADTIVLNNAIEPYCPQKGLNLFYNAKQIVVDRDPRDLYISSQKVDEFVGKNHMGFSSSHNLDNFIFKYKYLRQKSPSIVYTENDKFMKVQFEEFVLDYENIKKQILYFIGEDKSIHKYPKKYFDPEVSKKGVGMWKNVDGQLKKDVDKIYSELKEYCINI